MIGQALKIVSTEISRIFYQLGVYVWAGFMELITRPVTKYT